MNLSIGVLLAIGAMLFWGFSDVVAKLLVDKIGNFRSLLWSQIFGLIPYILIFFFMKSQSYTNLDLFLFILTGFLLVFGTLFFYIALEKGDVSIQVPLVSSNTLIIIIGSVIFLGDKLNNFQITFISLVMIGILLVSFKLKDLLKLKWKNLVPGTPYTFVAIISWGICFIIVGHLINKFSWFLPILLMKLFGIVFLLGYSPFKKKVFFPIKTIWLILILGLFDSFAFIFYGFAVNSEYLSLVSPVVNTYPIVAVLFGWLYLKEEISFNQWIGIFVIISGIVGLAL